MNSEYHKTPRFRLNRHKQRFYREVFYNLSEEDKELIRFLNYCQNKAEQED